MKTVTRQNLLEYLNTLLDINSFKDYSPNGLQVEGNPEIKKIITGVTACKALLDVAVSKKADAIIVHHGYFWPGENQSIVGMKQRRLKTLLENNINLFAYHLPLDAHPKFGNNVLLGKALNISDSNFTAESEPLVKFGNLDKEVSSKELHALINKTLGRESLHIKAENDAKISKVAWCTGAAQKFIDVANEFGADAYISGEISEATTHFARENNIHYFAAGHHATEKFGVEALGKHVATKFNVECEFIDIENPV